eukprot:1929911-Rhodomonas_salina.1
MAANTSLQRTYDQGLTSLQPGIWLTDNIMHHILTQLVIHSKYWYGLRQPDSDSRTWLLDPVSYPQI